MKKLLLGLLFITSISTFANDILIVQNTCDVAGPTRCYDAGLQSILNGGSTFNTIVEVSAYGGNTNHKSVREVYLDAAGAANSEVLAIVKETVNECEKAIKNGEIKIKLNSEVSMSDCMSERLRD